MATGGMCGIGYNHCLGIELTLLKGKDGIAYNFAGDAGLPNIEVVKIILDIMGEPGALITCVKGRPGHDRRYAMDCSVAVDILGFAPSVNFPEGIRRTVSWYQDNMDWLQQVLSDEYRNFMNDWCDQRH